ncbi:type II secretion system minor pseudopilin GspK [Variovorax saccharolyticus]|uniref:type II secretion system minor pseudopilin GspK n=1 Tax=Variovorax saccharolyticus TaxID=3053516 RepID=UPI002577A823|nr:type II secretion system minor pseudopilin GspK [Variovorax sp. J31P216]MDM0024848.1 type II secretion system minor pseudopilin GspK [Variovorax sp. J31P216]
MRSAGKPSQYGAALLTAMLTVTLVATFAAAALWQQWRSIEIEAAERARAQAGWVLIGALDWSRLILREDARTAGSGTLVDHLAEPWAVPLEEAKLTTFLAADKNIASDALEGLPDAFLSGRIIDAQSKLNVMNLVDGGKAAPKAVAAFDKLFQLLRLPREELTLLTANLLRAVPATASATAGTSGTTAGTGTASGTGSSTSSSTSTPAATTDATGGSATSQTTMDSSAQAGSSGGSAGALVPQRTAQLVWLGLSPSTVAALEPYVTVLPAGTKLNLNTASAEALFASAPGLDLAGAKRLVEARSRVVFKSLEDASALVQQSSPQFTPDQHGVSSNNFEVHARLRIDRTWVEEQTLLRREASDVRIVWRERGAGATLPPPRS